MKFKYLNFTDSCCKLTGLNLGISNLRLLILFIISTIPYSFILKNGLTRPLQRIVRVSEVLPYNIPWFNSDAFLWV